MSVCFFCNGRLLQALRPCLKPGSHVLKISLLSVTAFITILCVFYGRSYMVWLPPKQFVCYDSKWAPGNSWPDWREWEKIKYLSLLRIVVFQIQRSLPPDFLYSHSAGGYHLSRKNPFSHFLTCCSQKYTLLVKIYWLDHIKSILFHWYRLG